LPDTGWFGISLFLYSWISRISYPASSIDPPKTIFTLTFATLAALLPAVATFAAIEIGTAIDSFSASPPRSLIQAAVGSRRPNFD
jgi:hypothetical protein